MSLSGVPRETVNALWQTHCAALAPLTYDDEAVGELWRLFAGFLSHLPLLPVTTAAMATTNTHYNSGVFSFAIDIRSDALTPAMCEALMSQPNIVVPLLEFFRAVLATGDEATPTSAIPKTYETFRVHCAVMGDESNLTPFDSLGASLLGRLVTLRGTVVRMSPTRLTCVRMTYHCGACGAVQDAPAEDGVLLFPGPCRGKCRGYRWAPAVDAALCEELQVLKVQEHTDRFDASAGGSIHRIVEVELRGVWIDAVTVGEAVAVCGALGARRGDGKTGAATQHIVVRAFSITGGNISSLHNQKGIGMGMGNPMRALLLPPTDALEERGKFYEMARHPQWFSRLCQLLAPSIYGLSYVKAAIVLAVVGGAGPKPRTRSNIHLLMVGDPGLGKSQLLRAACEMAPRSAFVCAHTSSSCGLTLTLTRDPVTGETAFEAGAVVHGDGGITCIDEIDKGVAEHKALLEVMEQETVSIAKAGMVFGVPVHTSILAAGNPIGGRFDATKGPAANLNLSPALLTRFDIVVCLRNTHVHTGGDKNGDHEDGESGVDHHHTHTHTHTDPHTHGDDGGLSGHVLQLHRRRTHAAKSDAHVVGSDTNTCAGLSLELARRFIAFCRHNCQPVLREDASAVLAAHYLERRGEARAEHDDLPVTPRFLQSLIRLAEARAKVELRHEVTAEDAHYAVRLLQQCAGSLRDGSGARGKGLSFGGGASSGGHGGRKRSRCDIIVNALKAEIARTGVNALSHRVVLAACEEAGCNNAPAMLQQLNEVGTILQMGDKYQLRGV